MFHLGESYGSPFIFIVMNKRLFRCEIRQKSHPVTVKGADRVSDEPAYSLSNILQSAQLNRPLPPMHTYNFSDPKDVKAMDIPVVVDDICYAGNLQAQLDDAVSNAKARVQQHYEDVFKAQQNVPQPDSDSQPS